MNNKKRKADEIKLQDKEYLKKLKPVQEFNSEMKCKFKCGKLFKNLNERKNHYYRQCPISKHAQRNRTESHKQIEIKLIDFRSF